MLTLLIFRRAPQTLVSYPRETVRCHAAELYGVVAAAVQDDAQFSESLRQMHQLATSKVGRRLTALSEWFVTINRGNV